MTIVFILSKTLKSIPVGQQMHGSHKRDSLHFYPKQEKSRVSSSCALDLVNPTAATLLIWVIIYIVGHYTGCWYIQPV